MTRWGPGRIACVAIAIVLLIVVVAGTILCKYHGRQGKRVRKQRELESRCRALVHKERDLESNSSESGSGDFSCSGCSDIQCWGRMIRREPQFGSTLAVPHLTYDPDRDKATRPNDKDIANINTLTVKPSVDSLDVRMVDHQRVNGW
ncbi:hypothetical protein CspeluHIS016_0210070 [Cutaneotrichosporon spelunceum]|uniref:Uncharacterized protein n=1 Tax=Cutaneotrichosporon spelunceum TaxID=1672016 RepID=A0AAD3TT09_9TREE|nr:hypothetical protein CspeluHIS016_0210070 [Cutaneotrichosporon spelunceum]